MMGVINKKLGHTSTFYAEAGADNEWDFGLRYRLILSTEFVLGIDADI